MFEVESVRRSARCVEPTGRLKMSPIWCLLTVLSITSPAKAFVTSTKDSSRTSPLQTSTVLRSELPRRAGKSALKRVEWLGRLGNSGKTLLSSEEYFGKQSTRIQSIFSLADDQRDSRQGGIYATNRRQIQDETDETVKERQVWTALANLEADST